MRIPEQDYKPKKDPRIFNTLNTVGNFVVIVGVFGSVAYIASISFDFNSLADQPTLLMGAVVAGILSFAFVATNS